VIFQVRSLLPEAKVLLSCLTSSTTDLIFDQSNSETLRNNFIAGTIGGFVGTAVNTPFDVVKSRIQNTPNIPGQVRKYNWTYPSLVIIAREEGPGALYKGFVPKVLRLAPGGGVLLLVVDFTLG
jgi:solute carrier family 25 (mitochondrial 2-oxodicarboxylate transporter), member 21